MLTLSISPTGEVRFIYSDDARALLDEGMSRIERASHVEPCGTTWTADMAPVGGPILGPFATRADALAAEVVWLNERLGDLPAKFVDGAKSSQ